MFTFPLIIILFFFGCLAGVCAGLLGIGGGVVIVPVIIFSLKLLNETTPYTQQIAIGTSFFVMVFTTLSSLIYHHKAKNIDWKIFKQLIFYILIGIILGGNVARLISSFYLKIIFISFILFLIIKTLLETFRSKSFQEVPHIVLKPQSYVPVSIIIGFIASMVGVAGGALIVPFLSYYKLDFKRAIGTSAALAWPISISAAVVYLFLGLNIDNIPKNTFGFINLPLFAILACGSFIGAPFGVKLNSYIAKPKLKLIFISFLILVDIKMVYSLF